MREWIAYLASAIRKFSPVDVLVLKLFLVTVGVIFGVYLYDFFNSIITVVWMVFALSWMYIIARVFIKTNNQQ